jgi:hypothetical protein
MTTNQPDTDTSAWDRIDEHRSAYLDDQGSPGYDAVVVVTTGGEERLALCWRDGLNRRGYPYWPEDWRRIAPHELVGRLPRPYAPTCGRRATSSGKPCKVRVAMWGEACPTHAAIESHA